MADGGAYLQRLIEIHRGSVADQRSLLLGLHEVRSAADALVAVEALTRERANALVDAFTHELGGEGVHLGKSIGSRATASGSPAPSPTRESALHEVELTRVVPLRRELGSREADTRLILISLEQWAHATFLRWAQTLPVSEYPSHTKPAAPRHIRWTLHDDAGVAYSNDAGRGASDGAGLRLCHARFSPGLPLSCRIVHLDAVHHGDHVSIEVPLDGEEA